MNLAIDVICLILGVAVLLFLLYAPGAAILNLLSERHPSQHLFSGVAEWLFTAVMLSMLITGLVGFVLAELGAFSWWAILLGVLAILVVAVMITRAPLRVSTLRLLLHVPRAYPLRAVERRLARIQSVILL